MSFRFTLICHACLAVFWGGSVLRPVMADQDVTSQESAQKVIDLFQRRCVECHAGEDPEGRLNLETFEGVSKGNRRGAVVHPEKLAGSLLWEVVDHDRMPPEAPLSVEERSVLKNWILQGAPGLKVVKNQHWSFQPVIRPDIPDIPGITALTPVDQFLGRQLKEHNLSFRSEADRETLIRRVALDLTGLPPTPEDIERFLSDESPTAYERMVDRYLDSPRYGERWGKFWLDVAGYTESNGYFNADSERPWAFRYRDYVISCFNQDLPYDQFVREQIAGDELCGYRRDVGVTPEMVPSLVATQFLRNAQDGTNESDGNAGELLIDRFAVLEGNLQIVMNGLLGLTIQCARCHSHKFEPISHEEYYQLEAILYSAYLPEKWVKGNSRVIIGATVDEQKRHDAQVRIINAQVSALKASLEQIRSSLQDQLISERLHELPIETVAEILKAHREADGKRNGEQKELIKSYEKQLKVSDDDLAKAFPDFLTLRDQLQSAVKQREQARPQDLPRLSVLTDVTPSPPSHHILLRGQHNSPGPEVEPGVLKILTQPGNEFHVEPVANPDSSGRRTAFANWLTSAQNPLFARVMVNRIWQHHFGRGIVATPDNFGQSGAVPSHPELLDFLASEFVASGWKIKSLHRLILHSAAFRQSGEFDEQSAAIDPVNHLLWRYPTRRLDAEAIRDSMLFVSGELDLTEGGPSVETRRLKDGTIVVEESTSGSHRRSVYLHQRRTQVLTFLELFDTPTIVTSCGIRTESTVPLQSLTLLNSDFVRLRSRAFANRLLKSHEDDSIAAIRLAFRLSQGRLPTPAEEAVSQDFLREQQILYADVENAAERGMTDFCQMLMAGNGFLYFE